MTTTTTTMTTTNVAAADLGRKGAGGGNEGQYADVVSAFALLHWLWSATEEFGSLQAIVDGLASLARRAVLVQWIDPSDDHVKRFGHFTINRRSPEPRPSFYGDQKGAAEQHVANVTERDQAPPVEPPVEYSLEMFVRALERRCSKIIDFGAEPGSSTRRTFLCHLNTGAISTGSQ